MRKKINWRSFIIRQLHDGIARFKLMPFLPLFLLPATAQSGTMSPNNPYGIATNFNPSMTIIIVVLVLAFFFMGLLSVYIRQCAGGRSTSTVHLAASRNIGNGTHGLDVALIQAFPVFLYSSVKDLKIGKGTLECAVCLSEFEDEETLRLLPKCDHVFHPDCIDAWLASNTTCPVCRADLMPDAGDLPGSAAESPDSGHSPDEPTPRTELAELTQVRIHADEEQTTDSGGVQRVNSTESPQSKFQKSHSTGYTLGESSDRHTLRLPEEVRKQILSRKLRRTASSIEALQRQWSSRRGYRSGGEGSSSSSKGKSNADRQFSRSERTSRSDRWIFSKAPPFFSRTVSGKSQKGGADGDEASKSFFTSVIGPLDCLAVKMEGGEQQRRSMAEV